MKIVINLNLGNSNQGGGMMELKDTEEIKEGNVLGSLKEDDVMSRCVYPLIEL